MILQLVTPDYGTEIDIVWSDTPLVCVAYGLVYSLSESARACPQISQIPSILAVISKMFDIYQKIYGYSTQISKWRVIQVYTATAARTQPRKAVICAPNSDFRG